MNKCFMILAGLAAFLASCGTLKPVKDPASRHLLDPAVPYRAGSKSSPALAMARPALPAYLDRQQLVSREGGTLKVQENLLWSEPLDAGIARVLSANLSRLTGSTSILPVGDFVTLEYTHLVEMRFAQFDPDGAGNLVLECTWKLQPVRGADVGFQSFRTEVPIEVTLPPVTGRITAMNEALARLAREMAGKL